MASGRPSCRGQSLVEFALVLPLLLLVLVGILDFGRAIFAYNAVSNAARSAARVAIVEQDTTAIEAAAARHTIGMTTTIQVSYTDGGVTCSPVELNCIARVEVEHDFEPATPILANIIGPLTVSSAASMPVEHVEAAP